MRFWNWWQNGYNNAFRKDTKRSQGRGSVGLGGNISGSIYSCKFNEIPSARYEVDHDREDSGNGSIMRLAAMPIFYHSDIQKAREYAFESSFTTHPGFIAGECCSFMAYIIVRAIHGPTENIKKKERIDGELNFVPKDNVKGFLEFVCAEYAEILRNEQKEILAKIQKLESEAPNGSTEIVVHEDAVQEQEQTENEVEIEDDAEQKQVNTVSIL